MVVACLALGIATSCNGVTLQAPSMASKWRLKDNNGQTNVVLLAM